jgi:Wall-associated receptor kinase galacturonan-binding
MACVRQLQPHSFLYLTVIILFLPKVLATSITFPTSLPDCPDRCGDITIPYPFGTNSGCYRYGFNITCNESTTPSTAFLGSESESNMELIDINIISGEARVYNKYIRYNCYNKSADQIYDGDFLPNSTSLIDFPFVFSKERNKFIVIGCDALAYILQSLYLSGCYSTCDSVNSTIGNGGSCNGSGCCETQIPEALDNYEVFWADNNSAWRFNPCLYAMVVEEDWYKFQVQDLVKDDFLQRNKKGVPMVLDWAIRDNGTCQINGVEKSPNPACLSTNSNCYNITNGEGYLCNCSQGYRGNPYLPHGCIGTRTI